MDFYVVLDQIIDLLRRRGRVTYRALQLQFGLDNDQIEALKDELLYAQQLAVDEQSRVLVWVGDAGAGPTPTPATSPTSVAPPPPAIDQERAPLAYTPRIWPKKFSPPAALWKASANRSRCASAIWPTRPPWPNASVRTTCTPC